MASNLKPVSAVLNAPQPHTVGDGFRVSNFFPAGYQIKMSPFYLLDFNAKTDLQGSNEPHGVGPNPHRGFETVTIAYHGSLSHCDSAGNSGIINPGDVQWMTAASGVLHKEYREQSFNQTGGPFQMAYLWVNLPARDKMSRPRYQHLKRQEIKTYELPDQAGTVEIIAGAYAGTKGSACTFTPLHVYNARLNSGGEATFTFPACYNTGFLIVEGSIIINDTDKAKENQFVYFEHSGEEIKVTASENTVILVMSGEAIDEPLVHYGPFLMNTDEEIKQALNDYNQGCFGYLEE